jgi:hypothetical protein
MYLFPYYKGSIRHLYDKFEDRINIQFYRTVYKNDPCSRKVL